MSRHQAEPSQAAEGVASCYNVLTTGHWAHGGSKTTPGTNSGKYLSVYCIYQSTAMYTVRECDSTRYVRDKTKFRPDQQIT